MTDDLRRSGGSPREPVDDEGYGVKSGIRVTTVPDGWKRAADRALACGDTKLALQILQERERSRG